MARMPCRSLAALALAALPAIASGQLAAVRPEGRIGYAVSGGASVLSGTTANAASVHLGGEAALVTADSQWRVGCKTLWSRTVGESTVDNVTLTITQESRHRWTGKTWFWERLSLSPALHAGESARRSFDAGLAGRMTRLFSWHFGLTHRYDGDGRPETGVVTGIALAID